MEGTHKYGDLDLDLAVIVRYGMIIVGYDPRSTNLLVKMKWWTNKDNSSSDSCCQTDLWRSMAAKKKSRTQVIRKLQNKYRMVLINERTFEERFSIRLSRLNVIFLVSALVLFTAALAVAFIALTPLRQYIPGYPDDDIRRNAYQAFITADSLENELAIRDAYLNDVRRVLSGELAPDSMVAARSERPSPTRQDLAPSERDSLLRARIEREEQFNLNGSSNRDTRFDLSRIVFFTPLRGLVTSAFDPPKGHFGTDVVSKADEPVKCALDGTVVMAEWTVDNGYVIQVQHSHDLVSIYKHNSVLLKRTGDRVMAGEAIAIVGNTGELSDGPHLHFELWRNGQPVDPQSFMVFE